MNDNFKSTTDTKKYLYSLISKTTKALLLIYYITLHYTTLHYVTLRYVMLYYITLYCNLSLLLIIIVIIIIVLPFHYLFFSLSDVWTTCQMSNFSAYPLWNRYDFVFSVLAIIINPRSLGGGGGGQIDPPSIFLALNFCSLTDCQKLWHNCSLFVNTSFDIN